MELMRGLAFIALLFAGSAVGAELRQAEVCGDGTTHQAGYCPAVLSSASCSATGATTGSCSATSDEADGTRYVCATSNTTALTGAEIEACSGGAAIAGSSAAETGSNSVSLSGLTTDAAHYGQIVNESPEGWYSNRLVSSSFTPTGTGSSNTTRLNSALSGHTLPAAWSGDLNYPADPVITDTSTCASVTSATQFNNCAGEAGTRITVTSSFTGDVSITADDIDVVMSNALTITGSVSLANQSQRIRWTGGNIVDAVSDGQTPLWRSVKDILIDDVYWNTSIYFETDGALPDGQGGNERIAIINSTVDHSNSTEQFGYFVPGSLTPGRNADFIMANVRMEGHPSSASTTRLQNMDRLVVVDSAFNLGNGYETTGFRVASGVNQAYIGGTTIVGRLHASFVGSGHTYAIQNSEWRDVTRYLFSNISSRRFALLDTNSEGTVYQSQGYTPNSLYVGGQFNYDPFTDGGDNPGLILWDEQVSSLPSAASFGAQR